jgi:hypothetical protein
MPTILDDIVRQLEAAGIEGQGTTEAERAAELFDARDFDLVAFGSGLVGPVSDNLRLELSHRNPAIRFVETFAPVAVKQIAIAINGRRTRHAIGFQVFGDGDGYRAQAVMLETNPVRVEVHHLSDGQLTTHVVDERVAGPGPYELLLGPEHRPDGWMLMLALNDEEFHIYRMSDGRIMNRG